MGKYDFTPQRVHTAVTRLHSAKRLQTLPPWYNSVGIYPPAERLVRPAMQTGKSKSGRKSRMFTPVKITYPEDKLRAEFFGDHPWELARPRTVLESDGKDYQRQDWDSIDHEDRPLDGESVVQRQMWLMENEGLHEAEAYDKARKEFYQRREREEVTRRVAREEALYSGAQFGMSTLEVGAKLEDEAMEEWKTWARNEVTVMRQTQGSAYGGTDIVEESEVLNSGEAAEEPAEDTSKDVVQKKTSV